jgi:hypothetical protein
MFHQILLNALSTVSAAVTVPSVETNPVNCVDKTRGFVKYKLLQSGINDVV